MRAEIISVGTELLLGDIVNTNAQFLAQELAALGFTVHYQSVVGDNPIRLRMLIQDAKDRSDVLIFSGGLGPTEDDLTKETVAEAFGDTLILDPEELHRIEDYFKKRGRPMSDNNRKQAMVPRSGHKLANPNGTAPGAFFRQGNRYAFLLPGPPREMKPMFENEVRPMLEAMGEGSIRSITLRVFGIGESDLETKVATLLEGANPTAALYAKTGEVHIRVTAKAGTAEHAEFMCAEYADLFRKTLGDLIYSDNGEDLETTAIHLLTATGEGVGIAESCTGGLLGERITSVPGASAVFSFGAITYANEVKHRLLGVKNRTLRRHGAVSSQVAAEMAYGAAKKGEADYGIGITGIAGPDGGTPEKPVGLVYVALAHENTVYIKRLETGGRGREITRIMATQHALDMLRRGVLGLPISDAKVFTKNQHPDFERAAAPQRIGGPLLRIVTAIALIALVFALLMGALYLVQRNQNTGAETSFPSSMKLEYGSAEYTKAACNLVASASAENPSIVGMVALPGAEMEEFVVKTRMPQDQLTHPDGELGMDGMGAIAAEAAPSAEPANTMIVGGTGFASLFTLEKSEPLPNLTSFTYYTTRDAKEYQIFSLYLFDQTEKQADRFQPSITDLNGYQNFLTFILGAKSRSLYEIPLALNQGDSFMTLAAEDPLVPGRRILVCGKLVREGALTDLQISPAPAPLMPAHYYKENNLIKPNQTETNSYWLRWFLNRDVDNTSLQLAAGMPAKDIAPRIEPLTPETREAEAAAKAASESEAKAASDAAVKAASESAAAAAAAGSSSTPPAASSSSTTEAAPSSSKVVIPIQPDVNQRPDPFYLTVTLNGQQVRDTAINILSQICQYEVGTADTAVIQAQAIAAHSWILNQQGSGNIAPNVRGQTPTPAVREAVEGVAKLVLTADGNAPAFTPYFGMAALSTNTPDTIWGNNREYLSPVPSSYDQTRGEWRTFITLTREEMAGLLKDNLTLPPEEWGEPASWITQIETNDSGYVTSLTVGDKSVSGFVFWQQILQKNGQPLLPSSAFSLDMEGEKFVFTVLGKGHGCGMSQTGAAGLARDGKTHTQILEHYYPGTQLIEWK